MRHESIGIRDLKRVLPDAAHERLTGQVRDSEKGHEGEIRLVLESSLAPGLIWRGVSARERAVEVFSELRVWDTEANNGVLIYLLMADRDVEIVADRGIDRVVGAAGWEAICRVMEEKFRAGAFEAGLSGGIAAVSDHLERHFPARAERNPNELPDAPLLLG
jgi:uncharacterized membrane protein